MDNDDNDDDSPPPQSPDSYSPPPKSLEVTKSFKMQVMRNAKMHPMKMKQPPQQQQQQLLGGGGQTKMVPGMKVLLGEMAPPSTPAAVSSFIDDFTGSMHYTEQDRLDSTFHCRALEDTVRAGHRALMATISADHQTDLREALAYREVALKAVRLLLDAVVHLPAYRRRHQQQLQQQAKKKTEEKEAAVAATGSGGIGTGEASKETGASSAATSSAASSSELPSRSGKEGANSKESVFSSVTDLGKDGGGGGGAGGGSGGTTSSSSSNG